MRRRARTAALMVYRRPMFLKLLDPWARDRRDTARSREHSLVA